DQRDIDDYNRFIAAYTNKGNGKGTTQKGTQSDGGAAAAAARQAERRERLDRQRAQKKAALDRGFNRQKGEAESRSGENMKQLYVSYMKGIKGMPQQTALWGAGGAAESLKNRSQLNYENSRAKENREYTSVLGKLQQRYNDELSALEEMYLARMMDI
ncbi:MAG: hypothetical protein RSE24_01515, partial [Oscillospiraceae bacterium]